MAFRFNYGEEKNQLLKATRGIGFEDVIEAIRGGGLLADITHSNPKFPHQKVYMVKIKDYVYAVPYVINNPKKEIFLKTIYPSRALTKKYLKERRSL